MVNCTGSERSERISSHGFPLVEERLRGSESLHLSDTSGKNVAFFLCSATKDIYGKQCADAAVLHTSGFPIKRASKTANVLQKDPTA